MQIVIYTITRLPTIYNLLGEFFTYDTNLPLGFRGVARILGKGGTVVPEGGVGGHLGICCCYEEFLPKKWLYIINMCDIINK